MGDRRSRFGGAFLDCRLRLDGEEDWERVIKVRLSKSFLKDTEERCRRGLSEPSLLVSLAEQELSSDRFSPVMLSLLLELLSEFSSKVRLLTCLDARPRRGSVEDFSESSIGGQTTMVGVDSLRQLLFERPSE